MKLVSSVFLVLFFFACTNVSESAPKQNDSKLYMAEAGDKEMNASIVMAQVSLPQFDSAFLSYAFDTSTFALKVKFPSSDGGSEHIWATNIEIKDGAYYGIIDNIPTLTTSVKAGEKLTLRKNDITDWMYADSGVLRGGYTIRLIRKRMSKAEQLEFDKGFSLKIEDDSN